MGILLIIHGIIGDTEQIAESMKMIVDHDDKNVTDTYDPYDLILTYDYENLNTPIHETAKALAKKLADAGLNEDHGRSVTILAHSMGGLVARWFIEKEGGNTVITRLVMAGTPNNGSAFGTSILTSRVESGFADHPHWGHTYLLRSRGSRRTAAWSNGYPALTYKREKTLKTWINLDQ